MRGCDPDMAASSEFALIELRVKYAARIGETIVAVGEHPALGCWDPAHGVPMRPRPELSGLVWTGPTP